MVSSLGASKGKLLAGYLNNMKMWSCGEMEAIVKEIDVSVKWFR